MHGISSDLSQEEILVMFDTIYLIMVESGHNVGTF